MSDHGYMHTARLVAIVAAAALAWIIVALVIR